MDYKRMHVLISLVFVLLWGFYFATLMVGSFELYLTIMNVFYPVSLIVGGVWVISTIIVSYKELREILSEKKKGKKKK